MSARPRSVFALGAAVALAAAVLAGCASGGGAVDPQTSAPGGSASATPVDAPVSAAWVDGGAVIAIVTTGSSSCPPFADAVSVTDGVLSVSLMEPGQACTRDAVPRGTAITVPAGVDPGADLRIEVAGPGFTGTTTLPGASDLPPSSGLEGGQPSAGWLGPDALALLTWGSSSCPPQIAAAVVEAAEIAVSVATPPADQICTADFGPRVSVVEVSGAEAGARYDVVLSGAEPARVPVAGTP
jgi:hypothetical protein